MRNIIYVGPQKTASSSIARYFSKYGITERGSKESFYFSLAFNGGSRESYERRFDRANSVTMAIEPSYFSSDMARARIYRVLSDPIILVGVREPLSLYRSYALHLYSIGIVSKEELEGGYIPVERFNDVRYSQHVDKWKDMFSEVIMIDTKSFIVSTDYRKKIVNMVLGSEEFQFVEEEIEHINGAHAYMFGLGALRRLTPYINYLPGSKILNSVKKRIVRLLPRQARLPEVRFDSTLMNQINEEREFIRQWCA